MDDGTVTIIVTWVFTWVSEAIMTLRLVMRRVRGQAFDRSDYFTMASMALLIFRLPTIHVVLLWGTNNVSDEYRLEHIFTDRELYEHGVASKLVLAARVLGNT
jgi:hypothetical protein